MIEIRINRAVPSQNIWNNKRGYAGTRVYAMERDAWMALLRQQLKPVFKEKLKRRMVITSHRKVLLDYGNLVGGAKMIPDCLIRLGYLWDDRPEWFDCFYLQFKAPEALRGTTIAIQ